MTTDQGAQLAQIAQNTVNQQPEVIRSEPVPSGEELNLAISWLVKNGVNQHSAKMAVSKAVSDYLKHDRDWLNCLQGFVNKSVRDNATAFQKFNGEWLSFRRAVEAVRDLVAQLEEWEEAR